MRKATMRCELVNEDDYEDLMGMVLECMDQKGSVCVQLIGDEKKEDNVRIVTVRFECESSDTYRDLIEMLTESIGSDPDIKVEILEDKEEVQAIG